MTCVLALHAMERGHAFLYLNRTCADGVSRASSRAVAWLAHLLSDVAVGSVPKSCQGLFFNIIRIEL